MTRERVSVWVQISGHNERVFQKVKRSAVQTGGQPTSMMSSRIKSEFGHTGACTFIFPSRKNADDFKKGLANRFSSASVRVN